MILDRIQEPNDIKNIPMKEMPLLAEEIRGFLLDKVSKTGGHLASNLGTVELTMALHLFLNFPEDKIVWDVGHQSYTHKLLTGRKEGFDTLRKLGGMSGFPKTKESPCDAFNTGHSSTSISAALGIAAARELKGEDYKVVAVIGDGAMTGGLAYEALNNASRMKTNFIIIYNDNEMSISENVGSLSKNLSRIRTSENYRELKENVEHSLSKNNLGKHIASGLRKTKNSLKQMIVPEMFFEDMGITYVGPVDGYNIPEMLELFQEASHVNGAVLVHVKTVKGKGYEPAQNHPARFHGIGAFDLETGLTPSKGNKAKYQDVFSTVMRKMGDREPDVIAITAAMADGTGLKRFKNMFPERFYDVGIAEEHAVTFAAGMAMNGMIPVFAVYSSFLQRAYDQIVHDVCLQNLHVIFAIDRAGIVGADGETHHGLFDISFLTAIPNMTVMAPKNKWELSDMMKFAIKHQGPIAIRYPRGEAYSGLEEYRAPIELGKSEIIYKEKNIVLFAYGSMVKLAEKVRDRLKELGKECSLVNVRFAKPLDLDCIEEFEKDHSLFVSMEEGILKGGLGDSIRAKVMDDYAAVEVITVGIEDTFVEHGSVPELFELCGLTVEKITERILKA
jgi:1-deoxy-D-xylulose-5-phosphate synthase